MSDDEFDIGGAAADDERSDRRVARLSHRFDDVLRLVGQGL